MKKTEESIVNAFMEMEMCEVPDDCEVLEAETNEIDALMCEMCDENLMENIFNVEKYIKVLSQVQRVRLLGMHVLNTGELDGDPEKIKQVKDNIELSRTILNWDYDPYAEEDQKRIIAEMKGMLCWDEEEEERRLQGTLEEEEEKRQD